MTRTTKTIETTSGTKVLELRSMTGGNHAILLDGTRIGWARRQRGGLRYPATDRGAAWNSRIDLHGGIELNTGRTLAILLDNVCRDVQRMIAIGDGHEVLDWSDPPA